MSVRLSTYNIEHFDKLFNDDNSLHQGVDEQNRLKDIADIMKLIEADLIGIVEAPNTKVDGSKGTVQCLKNFANHFNLLTKEAIIGFPTSGTQEQAILFNASKFTIEHHPGGIAGSKDNPPFDTEFLFDSDDDKIKEYYTFYFPPLEVKVLVKNTDINFQLMLVHPKSKGIFNSMDIFHWESMSRRNRRKLYAECTWIRRRVDEWLDDGHKVIVMGDFNDGPGMDYYEIQFGKSAFELVMGDLFQPDKILKSYIGKPNWTSYGWNPASASFKDRFTNSWVNVLIDNILVSKDLMVVSDSARVWNPYQDGSLKDYRDMFRNASDHFPVTMDL